VANTKVQSEQIQDGSITADKIADGAIVATELANNAVTTAKINADAVTGAKIADDALDSEHYTDGSIDTAHIADAQITVAKMAANSVDSDQYVDGSIDTVHIGDLQVTTAKIANGNISTAKIADNAVTSAKIDTNIDIAGTFDVTGATTLDAGLTVDTTTLVVDATNNRVGIGTASPSTKLHLGGTAPLDSIIRQDSTSSGTNWEIGERSAGKWQIFEDDNDSIVATFMSTGRVGIGTESPDNKLHIYAGDSGHTWSYDSGDFFIIENSDSVAMNMASPSSNQNLILFSDNAARGIGLIGYNHNEDTLRFHTNNSEKVKIDANGQVVFKGFGGADGFHTPFDQDTGYTNFINAGGFGVLGREAYDTYITGNLYYHKTGGTAAWKNKFAGAGCSVISLVQNAGNQGAIKFITTNQSTSSSGESMTLLNVAMMDSDGLKFGGDTAAANALDDYEEGTFTPTILGSTTNPTMSYAAQLGWYQKVGNTVTVYYYVGGSQSGGAGNIRVGGLPFTSANVSGNSVQHYVSTYNVDTNGNSVFGTNLEGQAVVQFYQIASLGTWGALGYPGHVTGTFYLAGQFSYKV
jgi:hypothetical protein